MYLLFKILFVLRHLLVVSHNVCLLYMEYLESFYSVVFVFY